MFRASAQRTVDTAPAHALYDEIGAFLAAHMLDITPANFTLAYRVLSEPGSPLARTVTNLVDGGVRLTAKDVEALGGDGASINPGEALAEARELAARTRAQVEDFTGLVDSVRAEASGFSRDLNASVAAIDPDVAPELLRLTAAMIARVEASEARLQAATSEADALREQLQEALVDARSDPMTGLPNLRALTEEFDGRVQAGTPFVLALCDIDRFKNINDRHGHAVGDRVLRAIAVALNETCADAFVARYGGEEFALIFDGSDASFAAERLDQARAVVAGKRYRLRGSEQPIGAVSFSGGVVAVSGDESLTDAIKRADALLYGAKESGRNRISH